MSWYCHRRPDRSFFYKGKQFPVCSRCTGVYLGILFGLFSDAYYNLWGVNGLSPTIITILLVGPLALDGTLQLFGYYSSNNRRRLLTGLIAGVGLGMAIRLIFLLMN